MAACLLLHRGPETIAAVIADQLVVEWRDDIGRQAAKLLARQRDEFAAVPDVDARTRERLESARHTYCQIQPSGSPRL